MNTKKQKGFAIVNIVMGVILTLGSFAAFADPSTGAGGIIPLALGLAMWITGGIMLSALRKFSDDTDRIRKNACINTAFFMRSEIPPLSGGVQKRRSRCNGKVLQTY